MVDSTELKIIAFSGKFKVRFKPTWPKCFARRRAFIGNSSLELNQLLWVNIPKSKCENIHGVYHVIVFSYS